MAGYPQRQVAFVTPFPVSETDTNEQMDGAAFPRYIFRLLRVGQKMQGVAPDVGTSLAREVATITGGYAWLVLNSPYTRFGEQPPIGGAFAGFPIQLGTSTCGTLYVAADTEHPEFPALPLAEAHVLADICGLLLQNLEQSALLNSQIQRLGERPVLEPLTVREHEILKLICLGYDKEDIAAELTISPKTVSKHQQHIYEKLGVHNEREACLVAYREWLVSFLT